jgi:multidrug efflux system membrane fusion protein
MSGQTIVKLAQQNDKEIHFDIPEHRIAALKIGQSVQVGLWANDNQGLAAKIREIAAVADPSSRTYRVKASLSEGLAQARLGMTARVILPVDPQNLIAVPLSALYSPQDQPQQSRVWVVDEQTQTVQSQAVQIGNPMPQEQVAITGINAGQLLVSAGVQRLAEGQKVNLLASNRVQP